jgi:hypothetical protein
MKNIVPFILLILSTPRLLFAAVGCDLNDPDKDVKKLFPGSTGYKTEYVSISQKGGDSLLQVIEQRLGDKFQGLFETGDVPYTMYRVYRKKDLAGYIHGVNQKGTYGGIQVFLALDTAGVIKSLYFQKLTSRAADKLRKPAFGKQFAGLTLRDFYRYDVVTGKEAGSDRITAIRNPADDAASDFRAALRAVKKNLILVDEFLLGNRYLPYYKPN